MEHKEGGSPFSISVIWMGGFFLVTMLSFSLSLICNCTIQVFLPLFELLSLLLLLVLKTFLSLEMLLSFHSGCLVSLRDDFGLLDGLGRIIRTPAGSYYSLSTNLRAVQALVQAVDF